MKIGIIPNAHSTHSAVLLDDGDYTEINIVLQGDIIPENDLEAQIVEELRHTLLTYCWELRSWYGQWKVALLWAAVSLVVLSTQKLWTYGGKTALLYGWVYVLLFADGLMALSRLLCHAKALRRAKAIRKGLAGPHCVAYSAMAGQQPPARYEGESELEFVKLCTSHKNTWYAPYYAEMMAEQPRLLAGFKPNRLSLLLQLLFVGPMVPRPQFAMDTGRLT